MMTSKDFAIIASIIRNTYQMGRDKRDWLLHLDRMTDAFADALHRENPRFDRQMFLIAATPNWHRMKRGLPEDPPRPLKKAVKGRRNPSRF
jgi:hypothetical protein